MLNNIYKDKKVFITGDTGFKGSWLRKWLTMLGANVTGYALEPNTAPNHYDLLFDASTDHGHFADIRNLETLKRALKKSNPDICFHLAAQPFVKRSYADPVGTYEINIIGTVNFLEACREVDSIKSIIIVTTDKVYRNFERFKSGYTEEDILGGYDPYSASKVCAEYVTDSYRQSFFKEKNVLVATVRAGNILGGGDWGVDRIIPDLVRAYEYKTKLQIRNPNAIRPFQFILDALYGYLLLGEKLLKGDSNLATAFNFGTNDKSSRVETLINLSRIYWKELKRVDIILEIPKVHETKVLTLNSNKAMNLLNWEPLLTFRETVDWTMDWYKTYYTLGNAKVKTEDQIKMYMELREQNEKNQLFW